jgi:hypothetical protein
VPKFLNNLEMTKCEIRDAKAHVLASDPSSPQEGIFYYNSTDKTWNWYNGSTWVVSGRLDQISVPTAAVSLNSQRITNLAAPSGANDAARLVDVQNASAGLDVRASVRAATTANGTLATAFDDGSVIDGVTLATGDRILIKDQTDATANGIYEVQASGVPVRTTDADTGAELTGGTFVFVEEGTVNADTGWVASHDGTPTLGSTDITFTQFSSSASITAGAGLTKTGNTIDVIGTADRITVNANDIDIASTYAGQASIVTVGTVTSGTWSATTIALDKGGTGATTAAAAATALGVGTGDSPQFTAVNVGHASDTTLARASAGVLSVEGNVLYAAGGTDVAIADGGTGASTAYAAFDALSIHGADIASATTLDLDAATGNLVDVTGTTTITAITLAEGRERTVRFTGALILTHGSSLVLPGAANITTVAGDFAIFRGYAAGVVRCVVYSPITVTGTGSAVRATSPTFVTPALGTPSSGVLTNCTGLPQAGTVGLTTADSPQFTAVNVGHASDTTLARVSAGVLSVEGNTIYAAGGTDVPVTDGGTGSSTAAGARANLGALGVYSATIGDGVATSITVTQATHGLAANGTNTVAVYDATTGAQVHPDVTVAPGTGNVILAFSVAPTTNQYRLVIQGLS